MNIEIQRGRRSTQTVIVAESFVYVPGEPELDLSYVKTMGGGLLGKSNSMNKTVQIGINKLCSWDSQIITLTVGMFWGRQGKMGLDYEGPVNDPQQSHKHKTCKKSISLGVDGILTG